MDGHRVARKTLEALRKFAVQRVQEGLSPERIMEVFGFSRPCIYRWIKIFKEKGMEGLDAHPAPGKKPLLSLKQKSGCMIRFLKKRPWILALKRCSGHKSFSKP